MPNIYDTQDDPNRVADEDYDTSQTQNEAESPFLDAQVDAELDKLANYPGNLIEDCQAAMKPPVFLSGNEILADTLNNFNMIFGVGK